MSDPVFSGPPEDAAHVAAARIYWGYHHRARLDGVAAVDYPSSSRDLVALPFVSSILKELGFYGLSSAAQCSAIDRVCEVLDGSLKTLHRPRPTMILGPVEEDQQPGLVSDDALNFLQRRKEQLTGFATDPDLPRSGRLILRRGLPALVRSSEELAPREPVELANTVMALGCDYPMVFEPAFCANVGELGWYSVGDYWIPCPTAFDGEFWRALLITTRPVRESTQLPGGAVLTPSWD